MTQPQPSITATTHTLPFDRLSPRDFERLCLWLVEREGYEGAEHLGAAGSELDRKSQTPPRHQRFRPTQPGRVDLSLRQAQDKLREAVKLSGLSGTNCSCAASSAALDALLPSILDRAFKEGV
jgi:hypothetical protein